MGKTGTNQTTKGIIDFLNCSGFCVWKTYNGAVYSVKRESYLKDPNKLKGIADIVGFSLRDKKATHIEVEVKTGKDFLKPAQILHLKYVKEAGGIALVVKTLDDFMEQIKPYI